MVFTLHPPTYPTYGMKYEALMQGKNVINHHAPHHASNIFFSLRIM